MSDKPVAGLVTFLAVLPICAVCFLGPIGLGVVFGGAWGWLTGLDPVLIAGAALIGAILAYGLVRKRNERLARAPKTVGPAPRR